jgi:hypothetical protein
MLGHGIPSLGSTSLLLSETYAKGIVSSPRFDNLIGFCIFCNAVTIGLQTDYLARNCTDNPPFAYQVLDRVFLAIFMTELLLRFYAERCKFFYKGSYLWNNFDFIIVAVQVLEEILLAFEKGGSDVDLSKF